MPFSRARSAGMSAAESVTTRTVTKAPLAASTDEAEDDHAFFYACDLGKREIEDSTGSDADPQPDEISAGRRAHEEPHDDAHRGCHRTRPDEWRDERAESEAIRDTAGEHHDEQYRPREIGDVECVREPFDMAPGEER